MYSLAYGTQSGVHARGGRGESGENGKLGAEGVTGTGFVMPEPTVSALQHALQRALALFAQPQDWRRVQEQGIARDYGWESSARAYEGVYRGILAGR